MSTTTLSTDGAVRRFNSLTIAAPYATHLLRPLRELHRRVVLASAAYVALIVFTFIQALQGEPFLAFLS